AGPALAAARFASAAATSEGFTGTTSRVDSFAIFWRPGTGTAFPHVGQGSDLPRRSSSTTSTDRPHSQLISISMASSKYNDYLRCARARSEYARISPIATP